MRATLSADTFPCNPLFPTTHFRPQPAPSQTFPYNPLPSCPPLASDGGCVWCHVLGEGAFCTTKVHARALPRPPWGRPFYCAWRHGRAGGSGGGEGEEEEQEGEGLLRRGHEEVRKDAQTRQVGGVGEEVMGSEARLGGFIRAPSRVRTKREKNESERDGGREKGRAHVDDSSML